MGAHAGTVVATGFFGGATALIGNLGTAVGSICAPVNPRVSEEWAIEYLLSIGAEAVLLGSDAPPGTLKAATRLGIATLQLKTDRGRLHLERSREARFPPEGEWSKCA